MMIGPTTRIEVKGNYSIYQLGWMLSLPFTVICEGGKVALSEISTKTSLIGGGYMITARLSYRGEMKSCTVFT